MPLNKVDDGNTMLLWNRLYTKCLDRKGPSPRLRIGDCVHLNKNHHPFKKVYLPGWTEEVFKVTNVRPKPLPTYRVSKWDGTSVKGSFYEQDLQRVHVSDDSLLCMEKVLKMKKDAVLVHWKGWPAKYDSWIPH